MSFNCPEDRTLNQYWFSAATIEAFLTEIKMHATSCAFVSSPSLYFALSPSDALRKKSCVFEFDRQWETDEGFVFYDYHHPENIPKPVRGKFDYVVVDPPFITEEVWTLYAAAAKMLLAPGGKLLVTSVRENFAMLQSLLECPLYMAPFRPSIPHLVYQYDTYLSYNPTTAVLQGPNSELPAEAHGDISAVRMLNDLKESQEAFAKQMQCRDRTGEMALPLPNHNTTTATSDDPAMLWNRVPEGLAEYPVGFDPSQPQPVEDNGPVYNAIRHRRELCEAFKKSLELSVRALKTVVDGKSDGTFAGHVTACKKAIETLDGEGCEGDAACIQIMRACMVEVEGTPLDAQAYKGLVGEMTRKYKSRIFNHQKVLLQEMKEAKVGHHAR